MRGIIMSVACLILGALALNDGVGYALILWVLAFLWLGVGDDERSHYE